jgi:hypothetical protein
MVSVLGWIVWGIEAFLALSWVHGLRTCTRHGQPVPLATAVQTFFLWVIAIAFLFVGYSKLHILWVVAVCFLMSFFLTPGGIPILSPIVIWFTGLFVEIALLGLKRPARESHDKP